MDSDTVSMIDRIPEVEPLPEVPPNLSALAAGPFADGVHVRLKLNWDVTHLSEDKQKLLLHLISNAVKEFEKVVKDMNRIEAASKLGKLERLKSMKGNGQ